MKIEIPISSKIVKINGKTVELDVPAMEMGGRTLVPVRFVAEALNAEVEWDGENEIVNIFPAKPEGNKTYENVTEVVGEDAVLLSADGLFPEPYEVKSTESMLMLILKNEQALEIFDELTEEYRTRLITDITNANLRLFYGVNTVYIRVICDGKMYYEYTVDYAMDSNSNKNINAIDIVSTYYSNGKSVNVVKQYRDKLTYADFNLLSETERTSAEKAIIGNANVNSTINANDVAVYDDSGNTFKDIQSIFLPEGDEELIQYNARHTFEQKGIPDYIFHKDEKIEAIFVNILSTFIIDLHDKVWMVGVESEAYKYVTDKYINSGEITFENKKEFKAKINSVIKEFSLNDMPIETIKGDKFGDTDIEGQRIFCTVIEMKNPENIFECAYIAIVYKEKTEEFSYYTLEKSLGDSYVLCEKNKKEEHIVIGELENNYDAFLKAVREEVFKQE